MFTGNLNLNICRENKFVTRESKKKKKKNIQSKIIIKIFKR